MTGMQLNTDFSGIAPSEGGGSYFPVSDSKGWLCQITESKAQETANKDGTMCVMTLTGLEGPVTGKTHTYRVNVANAKSQKAVEIGFGELSAIAHVTGHLRVGNSAEWHMKPFRAVIVSEGDEQNPNRTRVLKVLDVNGNSPKDAGKGVMGGGQPAGGFGGQQQQGQGGGFGGGQQQGGFQGQGQGFGQGQGGNFAGNQGQAPQGSPQGGGFGNGQPQGQQGGGFDPNAGQQQQGGGFQNAGGFQPGQQQGGFGQQQQGGAPNWNRQ